MLLIWLRGCGEWRTAVKGKGKDEDEDKDKDEEELGPDVTYG
jgi:hypothetical protein